MSRGLTNITKPSMDRNPSDLEKFARQTNDWGAKLPFGGCAFMVWRNANQALGGAVGFTPWVPNTVIYDTDGFMNRQNGVITIPQNCGGWYIFTAGAYLGVAANGMFIIRVNQQAVARFEHNLAPGDANYTFPSRPVLVKPGDVIEYGFYQRAAFAANFTSFSQGNFNDWINSLSGIRIALP